jgi:hypothetical protein
MNKTLRSYTRRFFEVRVTIANITNEGRSLLTNGLFSKQTYRGTAQQDGTVG